MHPLGQLQHLASNAASQLAATSKDPYHNHKVAVLWSEQTNAIQAQMVGWTMEIQDRLEQAELALEAEETARWRSEATLGFFAGDSDY